MEKNPQKLIEAAVWIGQQQAFATIANRCSAGQAQVLKKLHDGRAYEQYGLTWEEFGQSHAGISRALADRTMWRQNDNVPFEQSRNVPLTPFSLGGCKKDHY